MSQPKIVVNKHTPSVVEAFTHLGKVIALETLAVTREAVRDADILVVRSETKVNEQLLEGSSVKFVGTVTIGTDHVDERYLASKGITFVSAPGSNSNSVKEYIASALCVWSRRTGAPLAGKTIGVVGVGNVGSKVASAARTLGLNVVLNDPPLRRKTGDEKYRPLDELMDADFITIHVPLTKSGDDATFHLFNEARIGKMKRGAVLINTSRGPVVETNALVDALSSHHLSASILDVWEGEPVLNTELLSRVLIGTPHIAGYSLDGKLNACRMVYEAACRFLGVQPAWNIDTSMTSESARIAVPSGMSETNEIVRSAVKQAYDIELDDTLLKKTSSLDLNEHGRYFMKLRAEYRIRREFPNRCVELSSTQSDAVNILQGLGLRISLN
jgi:erythronate-4-phosphate dehydrogenase